MKIVFLVEEDFVNYKKSSMFIGFPYCSFKCGREHCQNSALSDEKLLDINSATIVDKYLNNKITSAIVCGGLEPFDSWEDLLNLITLFRYRTDDDIVIYTGYNEDEIQDKINRLSHFPNIIVKFGRYISNEEPHYDEVLGIKLASNNQYAKKVSNDSNY